MDLNRSDRSEIFQDRELIEAVLQKPDELQCRLNESGGSRLSSILPPRPNGNLSRPSSFVSKRSVTLSQEKLSEELDSLFDKGFNSDHHLVQSHLHVLSLLCICSLVTVTLAMQLLTALAEVTQNLVTSDGLVKRNATYGQVTEVATALATFVVGLDAACLLVCSLQCLVVVKLHKVYLGEERAIKYLKDCSSSRFIAITGFFVSIPTFTTSVILYVVLRFSSTAAVTATVILIVSVLFCLLSLVQNVYHWKVESRRAHDGLPLEDEPIGRHYGCDAQTGKELSTLV